MAAGGNSWCWPPRKGPALLPTDSSPVSELELLERSKEVLMSARGGLLMTPSMALHYLVSGDLVLACYCSRWRCSLGISVLNERMALMRVGWFLFSRVELSFIGK